MRLGLLAPEHPQVTDEKEKAVLMSKRTLSATGTSSVEGCAIVNARILKEIGVASTGWAVVHCSLGIKVLKVREGNVGENEILLPAFSVPLAAGELVTIEPAPSHTTIPVRSADGQERSGEDGSDVEAKWEWDRADEVTLDKVKGLNDIKKQIQDLAYLLSNPEWFLIRKLLPPPAILFYGAYGTGKTMLAKTLVGEFARSLAGGGKGQVRFKLVQPSQVKDKFLGESAKRMQQIFQATRESVERRETVVLLLDEVDSLVPNRSDERLHPEYLDMVNIVLQEVEGGADQHHSKLDLKKMFNDSAVSNLISTIYDQVRRTGRVTTTGDIYLPEKDWTPDIVSGMERLKGTLSKSGAVAFSLVVGTTNDPCRVDVGFIQRCGDYVFLVPRPDSEAITAMLAEKLTPPQFNLSAEQIASLAEAAQRAHLTGRDIELSWLGPLRSLNQGELRITSYETVKAKMPLAAIGLEFEIDLAKRLRSAGYEKMSDQVQEYLHKQTVLD